VAGYDTQPGGDQDLCGPDLKYVEYSILFTKRDLETTLQSEDNEVIDYSTNGASFGGVRVARFMVDWGASPNGIPMPPIWQDRNYPPQVSIPGRVLLNELPETDQRFITFVYRVKNRLCKQSKEYDREEVEALRDIGGDIRRIWGGPLAVGPQAVGPQAVGPQAGGPQAVGPQAGGPQAVGAQAVGPRQPAQYWDPRTNQWVWI
jgi:hypothetical protein